MILYIILICNAFGIIQSGESLTQRKISDFFTDVLKLTFNTTIIFKFASKYCSLQGNITGVYIYAHYLI